MSDHSAIIIGASAAGLACAKVFSENGLSYLLLEKTNQVGSAWRNHYDRLHLHTNKSNSQLPFLKYGSDVPKYPSKNQVVQYLEEYVSLLNTKPLFNTEVFSLNKEGRNWSVITNQGSFSGKQVIFATGSANIPNMIKKKGLETFSGSILHSTQFKNGKEFKDKEVLVIGFGNSACEIAICLHEHGAKPSMSVRSPVNVIPKEILGVPVLSIGIAQSWIPPKIADKLNKPIIDLLIGDITKYGLKKLPYGPAQQIIKDQQIPLLDLGTMKLIKEGQIKIYGDISSINKNKINFEEGISSSFDAIIMATGFQTGLEKMIELSKERLKDIRLPIKYRKFFGADKLYFCGFFISPTGMIREMGIEAKYIVQHLKSNS